MGFERLSSYYIIQRMDEARPLYYCGPGVVEHGNFTLDFSKVKSFSTITEALHEIERFPVGSHNRIVEIITRTW